MTAEFAVALPAVLLVLGLVVGTVGVAAQQLRLIDVTSLAARSLAVGDRGGVDRAVALLDGLRLTERSDGELVCVETARPARIAGAALDGLVLTARSCALAGPLP